MKYLITLFSTLTFLSINAQNLPICLPQSWQEVRQQNFQIAKAFAPTFIQKVSFSNNALDLVTAFDYDGDLVGENNYDNILAPDFSFHPGLKKPKVYYSVVWTESHWIVTYAIFHPVDYGADVCWTAWHENDMEGIVKLIERPSSHQGAGRVIGTQMICHDYRHVVCGDVNSFNIESGSHCIYNSYHISHSNPCLPQLTFDLTYRHSPSNTSSLNTETREGSYRLESMFITNGMWDNRDNPNLFINDNFRGNQIFSGNPINAASAPWGWKKVDISKYLDIPECANSIGDTRLLISEFENILHTGVNQLSINGSSCVQTNQTNTYSIGLDQPLECPIESHRWELSQNGSPFIFLSSNYILNYTYTGSNYGYNVLKYTAFLKSGKKIYATKYLVPQSCVSFRTNETDKDIQENFSAFNLYPNPATNVINLQVGVSGPTTIDGAIFNELGIKSKVISKTTETGNVEIDVSSLPNGYYLFKYKINEQDGVSKFVIAR